MVRVPIRLGGPVALRVQRFARDDSGAILAWFLFAVLGMLMAAGVGIDNARAEGQRLALQNVADSAALAAANLSNARDPETVVRDYFERAGYADYLTDVRITQENGRRRVEILSHERIPTVLMRLFGKDTLPVPVRSTAVQSRGDVEIALVLDVSGSMLQGRKTAQMKEAAKTFVTGVAPADLAVDERPLVSIVPYNDMVNLGPTHAGFYALETYQTHSACIRFPEEAYGRLAFDPNETIMRIGHFDRVSSRGAAPLPRPQCPVDEMNAVLPYGTDPAAMAAHIDALQPTTMGWTAINLGLKWATALLDPGHAPITHDMVDAGYIHPRAAGLPGPHVAEGGSKYIVLMTDGANTQMRDLRDAYRNDGASDVWFAPSAAAGAGRDEPRGYAVWIPRKKRFFDPSTKSYSEENPLPGDAVNLTWTELFAARPMAWIGEKLYTKRNREGYERFVMPGRREGNAWHTYAWGRPHLDRWTRQMCDRAKAEGITIFTVAFEAPDRGERLLRDCASSPGHHFVASGSEIVTAFSSIAGKINQLRIVQ